MTLDANNLAKLDAVITEVGVLGVLQHVYDNAADTLGVANTALVRGALLVLRNLINAAGNHNELLRVLMRALADGATLARVITTSEGCTLDPAPRLRITGVLDETGWRLENAAVDAAGKRGRHG